MSRFGRKADGILEDAEGRHMTQLGQPMRFGRVILARKPITEWQAVEDARIAALEGRLTAISAMGHSYHADEAEALGRGRWQCCPLLAGTGAGASRW